MTKIGLLIPNSPNYPELSMNFNDGLHLALSYLEADQQPQVRVESIGKASRLDFILEKAQKLVLEDRVDLTIVFAGQFVQKQVTTFFKGNRKLVYFTGVGANFFEAETDNPFSLVNTYQAWESARAAGAHLGKGKKMAAFLSTFYDGGYQTSHGFQRGLMENGGDISFLKITPEAWTQKEFDEFVQEFKEKKADFAYVHMSTPASESFLDLYVNSGKQDEIPVMFSDITMMEKHLENISQAGLESFASWSPTLSNDANTKFLNDYQEEYGMAPDMFSLMGYEAGLLVQSLVENNALKNNRKGFPDSIDGIASPRGTLKLHHEHRHLLAPTYRRSTSFNEEKGALENLITETIDQEEAIASERIIEENHRSSGWLNPYLTK